MSANKIKLSVLADAFEEAFDGWEQYLNKDTGTISAVPESKGVYDDPDEWEEIIAMIEESEQFVRLPNQYEINEYRIMEEFADFAGSGLKYVSDERAREIGQKLFEALHGRGAFRRFKSALSYYDIADEYFAYRHIYYVELAKEWCLDHDIGFVRE